MNGAHDLEPPVASRRFAVINLFLTDPAAQIEGEAELTAGITADIFKFA